MSSPSSAEVPSLLLASMRAVLTRLPTPHLEELLSSGALPPGVVSILLSGAMGVGGATSWRPMTARLVLKHWPDETLELAEVAATLRRLSEGLGSPSAAEGDCDRWGFPATGHRAARTGVATHTKLMWAFLDGLGYFAGPLRTLDLRGAEMVDVDFSLSHHFHLLTDPRAHQSSAKILMDLSVRYVSDYNHLRDIFCHDEASQSSMIKVEQLSCAYVGGSSSCPSTDMLLSRLDPKFIKSLKFFTNDISNGELERIAPRIMLLENLTELDLSSGKLRVSAGGDSGCEALRDILKSLHRLRKINLSNNKMGGGLKTVLEPLSMKRTLRLQFLGLRNCGLVEEDIDFLRDPTSSAISIEHAIDSKFLSELKSFNIADNVLAGFHDSVFQLLKNLSQLQELNLEESGLPESQAVNLCTVVKGRLTYLRHLSLGGHHWSRDCLVECVKVLLQDGRRFRLASLVLPIYGLRDIMFRFKDRFNPTVSKMQLSRLLEPVAAKSSDAEILCSAVENRLKEVCGSTHRVAVETQLDGIKFVFTDLR